VGKKSKERKGEHQKKGGREKEDFQVCPSLRHQTKTRGKVRISEGVRRPAQGEGKSTRFKGERKKGPSRTQKAGKKMNTQGYFCAGRNGAIGKWNRKHSRQRRKREFSRQKKQKVSLFLCGGKQSGQYLARRGAGK